MTVYRVSKVNCEVLVINIYRILIIGRAVQCFEGYTDSKKHCTKCSNPNVQLRQQPTWMTALNQQVFPTLRMPTGQPSCLIQSAGLHISPDTSFPFLFTQTAFSSALASRALCKMTVFGVCFSVIVTSFLFLRYK